MKPIVLFSLLMLVLLNACAPTPAAPTPVAPAGTEAQPGQASYPSDPSYPSDFSYPSYPSYPSDPSYPSGADRSAQEPFPPAQLAGADNPYAPQPGDRDLRADLAYLETSEVQTVSGTPPEYLLVLSGTLPTPCHALRVQVTPPDDKNNIYVEVYSVTNPDKVCAQVIQPFEAALPLKNLKPGQYTLWLNNAKIATFGE